LGKAEPKRTRPKDSQEKDGNSEDKEGAEEAAEEADVHDADLQTASNNFTICAPQLLHLDTDGRPLWFNGWLLDNKFADKKKRTPAVFEAYLMEPAEAAGERDDAWQLQDNNICCLTSDRLFTFSEAEKETLEMISGMAKEVGAYGKG